MPWQQPSAPESIVEVVPALSVEQGEVLVLLGQRNMLRTGSMPPAVPTEAISGLEKLPRRACCDESAFVDLGFWDGENAMVSVSTAPLGILQ